MTETPRSDACPSVNSTPIQDFSLSRCQYHLGTNLRVEVKVPVKILGGSPWKFCRPNCMLPLSEYFCSSPLERRLRASLATALPFASPLSFQKTKACRSVRFPS